MNSNYYKVNCVLDELLYKKCVYEECLSLIEEIHEEFQSQVTHLKKSLTQDNSPAQQKLVRETAAELYAEYIRSIALIERNLESAHVI